MANGGLELEDVLRIVKAKQVHPGWGHHKIAKELVRSGYLGSCNWKTVQKYLRLYDGIEV